MEIVNRPTIVTTSWDDGDPNDLRIAELLVSCGLPGTFYIPLSRELERSVLSKAQMSSITQAGFEIGAHTVSHRTLTDLSGAEIETEVWESKVRLEQSLGCDVSMFCYPRGRYDARVLRAVKHAGFMGGRTTQMLSLGFDFPSFEMPTTLQAYPHRDLHYLKNLGRRKSMRGLIHYATNLRRFRTWVDKGQALFDEALRHGGVWHLYGHSWEIEELGIWNELDQMLQYVSKRPGVRYVANSEVRLLRSALRSEKIMGCAV